MDTLHCAQFCFTALGIGFHDLPTKPNHMGGSSACEDSDASQAPRERKTERERQKKEKKRAGPLSLEQARVRARERHGEMGRGLLRRRSRSVGHVPRKRKQGKRQHCGLARSGQQTVFPQVCLLIPNPSPKDPLSPSVSLPLSASGAEDAVLSSFVFP